LLELVVLGVCNIVVERV